MALLDVAEIRMSFGGITALDDVSLAVEPGEIVGLVGPNGAGKTTLFNCILGVLKPTSGRAAFDGTELTRLSPHRRARLGMARTFQRVELFPGLTAREHLFVAERARRNDGGLVKDLLNRSRPRPEERASVDDTVELLGLGPIIDQPVEALTLGQCRLVELGRALMCQPKLLLLDEPSSGLDVAETTVFGSVLTRVRDERGTAILLVEHDLDLVRRVVSRLYVLDFGRLIASGPAGEVLRDERVITAYLGVAS